MMRPLALLMTGAVLTACAVGPNYQRPSPAGSEVKTFAAQTAVEAPAPVPGQWWRLYSDPVLDALVQQALTENTSLQVAEANQIGRAHV